MEQASATMMPSEKNFSKNLTFHDHFTLKDLSQIYMGGRPETTKLFHFNLPIIFRSVDRVVNYH